MPVTRHPLLPTKPGDAAIAVDVEAVQRLESSLDTLRSRAPKIAHRFYGALFAAQPNLRAAFPSDLGAQHRKFIDSLVAVVTLLRDPDAADRTLRDLGARHEQYGACPEHYTLVRLLLLEAMAAEFGDQWTKQLEVEWSQALELVSNAMIEAGRAARATG